MLPVKPKVCSCDSEAADTGTYFSLCVLSRHVMDFTSLIFRFNSSVVATLYARPCRDASFDVSSPMTIRGCVGFTGISLPRSPAT